MKRIDPQTVIETLADCLRQNASLKVLDQKDPVAAAKEVAAAFQELDEQLIGATTRRRPASGNKR